ncbi:MAG: double-strand break repair helicase AddA [Pseudomonadota bacterium]
MADLIVPGEAADAQARSSDPNASVWVSANAGAGKTFVLAQRVVRLLLSGVPARAILCLTFTNAAAAEMAVRVFDQLARLATLPPAALAEEVARLAPSLDPDEATVRARTLFAEALETPGGLKVQTLHAFAAMLLRRFPLEANVSGAFTVMDEAGSNELTETAVAETLARASIAPDGWEAEALAALVAQVSDRSVVESLANAVANRRDLKEFVGGEADPQALAALLERTLFTGPAAPEPAVDEATLRQLVEATRRLKASVAVGERAEAVLNAHDPAAREAAWRTLFLTGQGAPRAPGKFVAKAILEELPDLLDLVVAEQTRLATLMDEARAKNAMAATLPLVRLAWEALGRLEADKRRRGLIDYDDQIDRALSLVKGGRSAAWVRYKLDEGIDHIMVDEAQDTSPLQWEMVSALTEEFFAGEGAREANRTLFVVGDEKQSIYAFQGAAPHLFQEKRRHYDAAAAEVGKPFLAVDLAHSFRSAPQVLAAVDTVFADPKAAASVGDAAVEHIPVRDVSGGVDVWPLFGDAEADEPNAWDAPFDATPDHSGIVRLTKRIADSVVAWTTQEGPTGGPALRPGDVMILSRKREPFATLMNRELKARGVPTAGADRLAVTDHIAVKDMMALARALITADDLSLAAVLKSPLFGFDEERLFALAHGRRGSLYQALQEADDCALEARTLSRWRTLALTRRPFDVFAHILIGEGRRADFAARMGGEALDALDAFLDMALQFESVGVPAMEPFLFRLSKSHAVLRRSAESDLDAVRVMTVHGAKGLEARLVFLADLGSGQTAVRGSSQFVTLPAPDEETPAPFIFAPTEEHRPKVVKQVIDARNAREAAEHMRLLYVGMTRAREHLVVCGAYGKRAPGKGGWHALVSETLSEGATPFDMEGDTALAWRLPESTLTPQHQDPPRPEPAVEQPAWLTTPALIKRTVPPRIAPSAMGKGSPPDRSGERVDGDARWDEDGDWDGHGDSAETARERGLLIHALLETADGEGAPLTSDPVVLAQVRKVLALPELAAPSVRKEVGVTGDVRLRGGAVRRVTGRIDRLQVNERSALIVDYKSDRIVPATAEDVPAGYKRQLAVYKAMVSELLPKHEIGTAIVWTSEPRFMALDGVLPAVTVLRTHDALLDGD